MDKQSGNIVFTQMKTRQKGDWQGKTVKRKADTKQRLRNISFSAAAVFCLGIGTVALLSNQERASEVMSHVTADFEYDETLGRLQFVSNILPESAMVFLESGDSTISVFMPTEAQAAHAWSQEEPWIEYVAADEITACGDGDVMTVVKNRDNEYTVRVMHEDGYESIYSGLSQVAVAQYDRVLAGEVLGNAEGFAAFELRKDGLSVLPQFGED